MIKQWLSIALALVLLTACSLPGRSSLQVLGTGDSLIQDVTFSPDGQLLAVGTMQEGAKIWRVADRTLVATLGQGQVRALAFSPDGQLVVTGGGDEESTVNVWRLADSALIRTFDRSLTPWVQSLDISPAGDRIAVGTHEKVQIFNMADGALVDTLDTSGLSVAYSPDGQHLAVGENLPVIRIWDVATKEALHTLPGHGFSLVYSSDGSLLAAPGWNNQGMTTFQGAETFPTTVRGENVLQIWNAVNGSPNRALNKHDGQIHGVAFSPDNQLVVSGGLDNTIRLARVADGTEVGRVRVGQNPDGVAFSPEGNTVALGVWRTVYLWPVADLVQTP